MKKSILFLLAFFCLLPITIKAETLNDAIAEANKAEATYNASQSQKAMTEAEKNKTMQERQDTIKQQQALQSEIEQAKTDITNLQNDINNKNKEIKEIMSFIQVSNGQSAYMEYIFSATSFTDLIYRMAISEQLTKYNNNLIATYNQKIKELDAKQQELANKKAELSKKEQELQAIENKLGDALAELSDQVVTDKEAYTAKKNYVNSLKAKGCSGTEQISACLSRLMSSSGTTVSSNGAYLPISSGKVSSGFGTEDSSRSDYHKGIDYSTGGSGSPVYAIANGQVVATFYRACGQNFVYIIHTINGQKYTTVSMHMSQVNVSPGQNVSANTVIGVIGPKDTCSSGPHIHLGLTRGWAVVEYSLGSFNNKVISPRVALPQTPAQGGRFSSRG